MAPVASYFIWHLTQGAVFATDPTLAQRTLLWDIQTGQWSEPLCRTFGIPAGCLPRVLPSVADYGYYLYKGVKIPICACVADQQAAAYYQGLTAGKTAVNYGTGAFVLHHTAQKPVILPGMLSSVAAMTNAQERAFLLEGPVFAAGSTLQWLKQVKGIAFEDTQLDALCAKAQEPVRFLPALGGLGAPYWDYNVKPVAENVTAQTTPADWVAGTVWAIAGRVADIIYYLRANGQSVGCPVCVSGGLSASRYLLQAQADLLQVTLQVQAQTQTTVLGTAQLAAVGAGLGWQTQTREPGVLVFPRLSPLQGQQAYHTWQAFVQKCRKQPS